MSFILKGLEPPQECRLCPCCGDNGSIGVQREYFCLAMDGAPEIDNLDRKLENCPIIDIPTPHGRLIDADDLDSITVISYPNTGDPLVAGRLKKIIAPTIIEAEVSE